MLDWIYLAVNLLINISWFFRQLAGLIYAKVSIYIKVDIADLFCAVYYKVIGVIIKESRRLIVSIIVLVKKLDLKQCEMTTKLLQ